MIQADESTRKSAAVDNDPYLWLEEVEGEKALAWVREQNKASLSVLQSEPLYESFFKTTEEFLNAQDKIPYGKLRNKGHVYNFWRIRSM